MTTIPPNWMGSIIQTQGAEKASAERKAKESAAESEQAGGFAEKLQNVIENNDRDSQVFSDAEGAGSQGHPFEEGAEGEPKQDETSPEEDDAGGLDVQA